MKKTKPIYLLVALFLLIIIAFILFRPETTGENDDFVNCLAEKDAKFYGAYWCGHCKTQKDLFGDSLSLLKDKVYVECAEDAFNNERDKCIQAGIVGYPTWVINGNKYTGTKSLNQLSELTGCEI